MLVYQRVPPTSLQSILPAGKSRRATGGSDTGATSLPALVQRAAMVAKGDQSVNRTMAVLSGPGPSTACAMFLRSNPTVDLFFPILGFLRLNH